ncbi:MAG: outer membrane protein assembly factor BamE [Candidatus Omnitrophica bacterium]|nr:outer membrane protein assembly factor BamE [Candidatus Omnitrophota bacterium]
MLRLILLLVFIVSIFGCSQQLKTLMIVSKEKAEQERYIDLQNSKFAQLLKDAKADKIKEGLNMQQVVHYYGEPLLVKEEDRKTVYLYRDAGEFFAKEKVYLYFDSDEKLESFILEEIKPSKLKPAEQVISPGQD